MASKAFGPIESDYAFFMTHATEAACDAAVYERELKGFAEARTSLRLLDFGCGAGDFSLRLLSMLNWPPEVLHITLVEPVQHQRHEAARRLAAFSRQPIDNHECLPDVQSPLFDVILSNHALYYVSDLATTLARMTRRLCPSGTLLLAIAPWDNVLLEIWKTGFALLDQPVPYYGAEDVEAALTANGSKFRRSRSTYQLLFPDSEENRLKILRFLFGDELPRMRSSRLLGEFDRHVRGDHVAIYTHSDHFTVNAAGESIN